MDEGWDAAEEETALREGGMFGVKREPVDEMDGMNDDGALNTLQAEDFEDMLRFSTVHEVTSLLRSNRMARMVRQLDEYNQVGIKNAITKDDPEHQFVCDCSSLVLQIEVEKSKAFVFLREHYAQRFPELAMFFTDSILYCRVVKLLLNNMDLTSVIDELDELLPSQLTAVVIACASTTAGRELTDQELQRVQTACMELETLETAKQTFLEYIQRSMPLIAPNLCALLGTGITSQLFAITGSVTKIATMDPTMLAQLGSARAHKSGIAIRTTGFLSNSDLVANHEPQLRPKALRLVASTAVNLARIDDNRRASSNEEGLRQRESVRMRMLRWLDPPVIRGAGHNTYERRDRRRAKRPR